MILKHRSGSSIIFNAFIIMLFLIATGTAFMMWAVDENYQADFDLARSQAYYTAQYGIVNEAMKTMRTRTSNTLPGGYERLNDGNWNSTDNSQIGRYTEVGIRRVDSNQDGNLFQLINQYDLEGTGNVVIKGMRREPVTITRTISMRAQIRTFASYMYLTNEEQTMFQEIIWFWTPDTLYGRVHSNSHIGIKYRPLFYGPVSTTESDFIHGAGYNPYFAHDPQFNAPVVYFPLTAENLRAGAASGGSFITNNQGMFQTRIKASHGAWMVEQWRSGIPYDSSRLVNQLAIPFGQNLAIFVEGDLQLFGSNGDIGTVSGRSTIGASGNIELWDNILYEGYTTSTFPEWIPESFGNMLGIVSESKIVIKDVTPNGRGNGLNRQGGHSQKHIVITAALVALGEQFTFEHQNDQNDNYIFCTGDNEGSADERGTIYLRGAVNQARRGYVHRSTCGGTGYAKDYYYDFRLETMPPPFYLDATDDEGASLFDIVWWRELNPE